MWLTRNVRKAEPRYQSSSALDKMGWLRANGLCKAAAGLFFAIIVSVLWTCYPGHQTPSSREASDVRRRIRGCVERQLHPCSTSAGRPPWLWTDYVKLLDKINVTGEFLGGLQLRSAIYMGSAERQLWTSLIFCMRPGLIHSEDAMPWLQGSKDRPRTPLSTNPLIKMTYENFDGVEVIVYQPRQQTTKLRRGLVFFHGGGWVIGKAEYREKMCELLANRTNMVVINVNYRMAPEYVYPTPLNDCITATKYALTNARRFGIDANRIAVGGDSSGGNLAAAVTLTARDENWALAPIAQLLIYPPLQAINFNTPSFDRYRCRGVRLDQPTMVAFWLQYAFGDVTRFCLNDFCQNLHVTSAAQAQYGGYVDVSLLQNATKGPNLSGGARADGELWASVRGVFTDPHYAPLMAKHFSRIPSTFVATVERDVLTSEVLLYVHRLRKAGVVVRHMHYDAAHGELVHMFLNVASNMAADVSQFLKDNL